jgi:hypothetical protein
MHQSYVLVGLVDIFQDPSLTFNMVDQIYNTVYRLYVYFGVTGELMVIEIHFSPSLIFVNNARTNHSSHF